ncbi:MAG: response regulator transcription factor, partial [Actinomycetales bacterium]
SGALRAGAAGFVLKDTPAEDLIRAVRAVATGQAWLDPAVTARVLTAYRTSPTARSTMVFDDLTSRELEVLTLMARGLSNPEIASQLFISELTVKSHVGRIFSKLDLRDRPAAIVLAHEHGLV